MMKHITTSLLLVLLTLAAVAADEIKFVENMTWAQVKEKALKEKKMIFLDAYATWCGPCKYMEKSVYTQKEAADFFNSNFINVKMDMETGEGPGLSEEFDVTAYPTFLFFSPEGKLLHKYVGALEAAEFVGLGKDATEPGKQYFTLKEKAARLELSDAAFSHWALMASDFKDEDRQDILDAYFASKKDILANKDIASTVLFYTSSVTDQQLFYLYQNKQKIKELMTWDDIKTATILYDILFSKAIDAYDKNSNSIDSFLAVVGKFNPSAVEFAKKDLSLKITIVVDRDSDKATELWISYLKETQQPVNIEHLASWIIDYASRFTPENMETISSELAQFKLRPADK